jgi:glycosyltransferase involved in cell wall biosynthesis
MRILIASQDWDYRFARPQQMARILAERHEVTYLATGPGVLARTHEARTGNTRWRPPSYRIGPRLQAFSALYLREGDTPEQVRRLCLRNGMMNRLLFPRAFRRADILVVTNPLHYHITRALRWDRLVYDCLDRYEGFFPEGSLQRQFVIDCERRLLDEADWVFASAKLLVSEKSNRRPVYYLPHGVPVEYFEQHSTPRPEDLRDLKGPIAGFIGGIEHWVNLDWVIAAAEAMPGMHFVLVGDVRVDLTRWRIPHNVRFLGYRPYCDIPRYVATFDVGLIPFQMNHLTEAVNPIKILEYFALGKPVVSSHMPELEYYQSCLALVRETGEFVTEVSKVIVNDREEQRQARRAIARSRSWRRITEGFLNVVERGAATTGF